MEHPAPDGRRLFIALRFGAGELAALSEVRDALCARLVRGTPAPTDSFHLTLAFLGTCRPVQEEAARAALAAAADASGQVTARLGALGRFARPRGSVVWRSVSDIAGLMSLQARLAQELEDRGFEMDMRPYVPHVTLVRGARTCPEEALDAGLSDLSSRMRDIDTVHRSVSLMWSRRPEGGRLVYTPIATESLRTGTSARSGCASHGAHLR